MVVDPQEGLVEEWDQAEAGETEVVEVKVLFAGED